MSTLAQPRPVTMAALLTALVMAGYLLADPAIPSLPVTAFGVGSGQGDGPAAAGTEATQAAAPADALPLYAAYIPACDLGSTRSTCPADPPVEAPVVGRIDPDFGRADGWLAPGSVDRFDLREVSAVLAVHLEGDDGAVLGVYAAGRTLVSPADGQRAVSGVAVPPGVDLVQVVVHNPTAASREYRLVLG